MCTGVEEAAVHELVFAYVILCAELYMARESWISLGRRVSIMYKKPDRKMHSQKLCDAWDAL